MLHTRRGTIKCVFRQRYLSREFGTVTVRAIYVPPSGNDAHAAEIITYYTERIETDNPDSPLFIMGDFNSCRLTKSMPTFQQYIKCATRGNNTLDLCYVNLKKRLQSKAKTTIEHC